MEKDLVQESKLPCSTMVNICCLSTSKVVNSWTQINDESRNLRLGVAHFTTTITASSSGLSSLRELSCHHGLSSGPRGGWYGPDPSNDNNIQVRQWSANAPAWRIAVEGLSLEGK